MALEALRLIKEIEMKKIVCAIKKIISVCLGFVLLLPLLLTGCSSSALWIVIPEGADTQAAEMIQQAFRDQWEQEVEIVRDSASRRNGTEILVGATARKASKQAMEGLRAEDFVITFSKRDIAIVGGSDQKTMEAAQYFVDTYLDYYVEKHVLPNSSSENYASLGGCPIKELTIGDVLMREYVIVTKDGAATPAAVYLQTALAGAAGYVCEIVSPQQAAGQPAFVFGSSGMEGAQEIVSGLKKNEYRLLLDGQIIWLCAGAGEDETAAAKMLVMGELGYERMSGKAKDTVLAIRHLNLTFTTEITKTEGYSVLLDPVFRLPAEDAFTVFQGGCTDGRYAYYVLNNQTHHPYTNYIYKVDTTDWTIVKRSQELALDHANSLTYNEKLHQLIVSNYEPNRNMLTYVDADTLEITGRKIIGFNALSITYNAASDRYAFGLEGTYNFVVTDSNFQVLNYYEGLNYGYIRQELECDDTFLYFTQSSENHIIVHDWQGNYYTSIKLGQYVEVENLFFVDGVIYTGFFSNGGVVYETTVYRII